MRNFILSCESTIDLPYSYVVEHDLPVLFYSYIVDEKVYPDDMGKDPHSLEHFYGLLDAGKLPSTSQLNIGEYTDFFEEQLKKGQDVLHIAFGSGMTQSVNNAFQAAEILREQYPDRRLEVFDSTCSSSGYGLLVDGARELADQGKSIDDVLAYLAANCRHVHHQFFSTDLKYFKRSGRVSGAAATIGAILNICPIMHLDYDGRIIAYGKVRGKKNALRETVETMAKHAAGGTDYSGKCWICHSNCRADAEELKKEIQARFPHISGEILINNIGTIIAAHSGPGTVAAFFFGDEREKTVQ